MKKIELLFIFLICGGVVLPVASGQNESHPYNFPIGPGTEEWAALESYEARLDAYNIPDSILEVMTTADLVETCLHYPEFRLIMIRNSLQQGYDYLKSIFNGFGELEQRPDAGAELIRLYSELDPINVINEHSLLDQGRFSFQFTYLEIVLAQVTVLSNLNLDERISLIERCLSNYKRMKQLPEYFSTFGLVTPSLVLGRLMEVDRYSTFLQAESANQILTSFIAYSLPADVSQFDTIVSIAREYLKSLKNE